MTYPDACVASAVNEYFIPVQINVDQEDQTLQRQFRVLWTPNINILDPQEKLLYHVEGWLPPSDFSAMLMVAHAHYFMQQDSFQKAEELFKTVWDKYPQSQFAAEALYYLGVSRYKDTHDGKDLVKGWRVLQRFHPESTWAIRSSVL